jgi:hypothetical protein
VAIRACKERGKSGDPCGAPPLQDRDFCLFHDPEHADAVAEARKVGGGRRRREATVAVAYDFAGLDTVPGIRRLLDVAALDTLAADNTPNRARTLAYIAQIAMRLLEVGDLEERLQQVEQALGPRLVRERKRR